MLFKADITKLWRQGHVVCVTTNGFIKRSGEAVMGKGNALAMARLIPELPRRLGNHIRVNGNHVGLIYRGVISFPVKPTTGTYDMVLPRVAHLYKPGDTIPGFHCKARLNIISRSVDELNQLVQIHQLDRVYLPLPGIGNGGLSWQEVRPLLEQLDKTVVLVSF